MKLYMVGKECFFAGDESGYVCEETTGRRLSDEGNGTNSWQEYVL